MTNFIEEEQQKNIESFDSFFSGLSQEKERESTTTSTSGWNTKKMH